LRTAQAHLLAIAHALARLPADASEPADGAAVRARVEACLAALLTACADGTIAVWLRPKLEHVAVVLRRLGDGLYHCYDVPGLPRTDNELEQFYRRLKAQERRITGRKRADNFVVRFGGFAVYALAASGEPAPALARQLATVPTAAWRRERAVLRTVQARQTKMRRFHLHRSAYLADLEARWTALCEPP
jgi:hypothetical protein